jgi:hypothetical protein
LDNGEIRFDPLTVRVTVTPVDDDVGVITTEEEVELVGVAPEIVQLYVGDVMFAMTADKVAFAGVKAPPAF